MWVLLMDLRGKRVENKYIKTLKGKRSVPSKKHFFLPVKRQVHSDFIAYSRSHGGGGGEAELLLILRKKRRNESQEEGNERGRTRREREAQYILKETPRNFTTLCHK